jgi:hypothetical protein
MLQRRGLYDASTVGGQRDYRGGAVPRPIRLGLCVGVEAVNAIL